MSLTIRARALLSASLIIVLLLAPTIYSIVVLRQISTLASTLAERDARASVEIAKLYGLLDQTSKDAKAFHVNKEFFAELEPKVRSSIEEMRRILGQLKEGSDAQVADASYGALESIETFRERATAPQSDELEIQQAGLPVKDAIDRLRDAVHRLSSRRTAEARTLAQRAATLTLLSTLGAVAVAAVLTFSLLRALGRPLRDLQSGTARVAMGRFDEPIPVRATDELGRLAEAFNRMAGALAELDRMKAEFLAAASHGLRTPIACAKGYLASLSSGRQGALTEESRRAIARTETEIDRVSKFVDQLLDLGRLRAGRLPMSMREVPTAAFFTSVGRSFDALAEERGIAYSIQVGEGLPARISADPDKLSEALTNLLGNAFKYTPTGGSVSLLLSGEDGWVRVEVADTGPGIPREEVRLIFEKYYRGGGVTAEGAGLGLAISRGIIERHGGVIWAESEEGSGARFIFRVPVRSPASAGGPSRTPRAAKGAHA